MSLLGTNAGIKKTSSTGSVSHRGKKNGRVLEPIPNGNGKVSRSHDCGASLPVQSFHDGLTDATIEVIKKPSGWSSLKITNGSTEAVGSGSLEIVFDDHGMIQAVGTTLSFPDPRSA